MRFKIVKKIKIKINLDVQQGYIRNHNNGNGICVHSLCWNPMKIL